MLYGPPVPSQCVTVTVPAGERIHTENSYKYRAEEFEKTLRAAGFASVARWASPDDGYFVFYAS